MSQESGPHEVRQSPWTRWTLPAFTVFFLGTSLLVARTEADGPWWMFAVLAMGTAPFAWRAWAGRTTVFADHVEIYDGYRTLRLGRADILGYRKLETRSGERIKLELSDGRKVAVPPAYIHDPVCKRRLGPLTDLDARDLRQSRAAFESDPDLGMTDAERNASLKRLRAVGWISNGIGVLVGIALLIAGRAPDSAAAVGLVLPPAAFAIQWWSHSAYVFHVSKTEARPTLFWLIAAPIVGTFVVTTHLHVIDLPRLLLDAAIMGSFVTTAVFAAAGRLKLTPMSAIFALLLSVAYAWSLIALADIAFDTAKPRIYRAAIERKTVYHGKSTSYALMLGPWGPEQDSTEVYVASDFYQSVTAGRELCVALSPGRFGLRWYRLARC